MTRPALERQRPPWWGLPTVAEIRDRQNRVEAAEALRREAERQRGGVDARIDPGKVARDESARARKYGRSA